MKVSAVQTFLQPAEIRQNVEQASEQVQRVIDQEQPDLVVLPEAFTDYFPLDAPGKGEPLKGDTTREMMRLAAGGSCLVLFGLLRREEDGLHNTAILVNGERVLETYDKSHLWYRPPYPEQHEYGALVRGDRLGLFDTELGRLGVMICHDGAYPELPRALAMEGADLICWLMNNGNHIDWASVYAKLSVLPVIVVNTVTPDQELGGTAILDGDGKVLTESSLEEPAEVTAELDLEKWRALRTSGEGIQGLYRARRPELYRALTRQYPGAEPLRSSGRHRGSEP